MDYKRKEYNLILKPWITKETKESSNLILKPWITKEKSITLF